MKKLIFAALLFFCSYTTASASTVHFTDANEFAAKNIGSFDIDTLLFKHEEEKESREIFPLITYHRNDYKHVWWKKDCDNPPPVPLPASAPLFLSGIIFLFGVARRRQF